MAWAKVTPALWDGPLHGKLAAFVWIYLAAHADGNETVTADPQDISDAMGWPLATINDYILALESCPDPPERIRRIGVNRWRLDTSKWSTPTEP